MAKETSDTNNEKTRTVAPKSQAESAAAIGGGHTASPQVVNGVQVRTTSSVVGWRPEVHR